MGVKKAVGAVLILVVIGIAAGGFYLYNAYKSGKLAPPELRSVSHEWGQVTLGTTEIKTTAEIYNPNPVSIPIKRIHLTVLMNGIKMAEGEAKDIKLEANKVSKVTFITKMDNNKIPDWWYTHIKNGEHSEVNIQGTAYFELLGQEISFPFETSQEINTSLLGSASMDETVQEAQESEENEGLIGKLKGSIEKIKPKTPVIEKIEHSWGEVTPTETEIVSKITIYNPNIFPIYTSGIDYKIYMNGIEMARGQTVKRVEIPAESRSTVIASTKIDNSKLPRWWVTHITRGEKTELVIEGGIIFDVKVTEIRLPLISYSKTINTNILGGG